MQRKVANKIEQKGTNEEKLMFTKQKLYGTAKNEIIVFQEPMEYRIFVEKHIEVHGVPY